MGLLDFFRGRKKPKLKTSTQITVNTEIDPIYFKRLDNGLLPGEIVLMDWFDGKPVDTNPPGYFEYRYGINVVKSTKTLMDMELLVPASPKDALKSLKVTELKEILQDNELKTSGKKIDLIQRLSSSLSDEEITKYIKEPPLVLSTSAKLILEKYYYIVNAHKQDSKDGVYCVATAINFMKNNKLNFTPNSRDISWALFQEAYLKNHQNKMYGLARNNMLAMAKQLQRENNLKQSLKHYLDVCIMDLSGLANSARLDGPNLVDIPIGIVSIIKSIIKELNISNEELSSIFSKSWENTRQSIPFHYLTKEESFDCLIYVLNNDDNVFVKETIESKYDKIDRKTFENTYNLTLPIEID